jgi:hypothetical protein
MSRAVSGRPLPAEARVQIRTNLCGICGGKSSTVTGFAPLTSLFPCQYYSANAAFLY